MGQISCRLASSVHFLPVAAGLLESSTLFVSVICISMHQEFWYRGSSLIPCEGSGYISVIACPLTFHLLHNFTWILLKHMYMLKGNDGFFSNIFYLLKVVEIIFIARPILKSKTSFQSAAVFIWQHDTFVCFHVWLTAISFKCEPFIPWTKYTFFWLGEGIYCYRVLINFTVKKCRQINFTVKKYRQFRIRSFYLLNLEYFALYYKTSDLKIVVVLESYLQMNTCNNFSK